MSKIKFLDKRNVDGSNEFILFSAYELSLEISEFCLKLIKEKNSYLTLIKLYSEKYINIFFLKFFFYEILPIANQIVINRHDFKINNSVNNKIDLISFTSKEILKILIDKNFINYKTNLGSLVFKKILKKYAKKLIKINNNLNSQKIIRSLNTHNIEESYLDNGQNNIGIKYAEGLLDYKRSDLFWYNKSNIDPKNVIIYFEEPYLLKKHSSISKTISILKEKKINYLFLWKNKIFNLINDNSKIDIFTKSIHKKSLDSLDLWLYSISKNLIIDVEKWKYFFNFYKIRIHLDPTEYGTSTIIKQIALKEIDGSSIGKLRSYPPNLKGAFLGYYTNDVFFTWGKDSLDRINNSKNIIDNALISGFPYIIDNFEFDKKLTNIKNNFKKNGVKKTILILDTNHSLNKNSYFQYIPSDIIYLFYKSFIDLIDLDKSIGLIFKPKKNTIINNFLPLKKIIEKSLETKRCYLEEESFQIIPSSYAEIADITIGIGSFIPSALLECASKGNRSILYDYSHFFSHEKKFYESGNKNFLFNDLNLLLNSIKAYFNDPQNNNQIGNWNHHKDDLDSFRDNKGFMRIGSYISNLKNFYDKGFDTITSINETNKLYKDENFKNLFFD